MVEDYEAGSIEFEFLKATTDCRAADLSRI